MRIVYSETLVFQEGGKPEHAEINHRSKERNNNKLDPHKNPGHIDRKRTLSPSLLILYIYISHSNMRLFPNGPRRSWWNQPWRGLRTSWVSFTPCSRVWRHMTSLLTVFSWPCAEPWLTSSKNSNKMKNLEIHLVKNYYIFTASKNNPELEIEAKGQTTNTTIDWPTDWLISQSVSQSVSQDVSQSVGQQASRSVSQSVSQSVNQSVSQSAS